MDSEPKGLGDFPMGKSDAGTDEISAAMYREELNDLRIEKLGNRITIISVILPCLIGAVIFFAYMDMQERMASVHDTGQTEVQEVAEDLGAKLNAMTVDLAGVQHKLATRLPVFDKTIKTLESDIAGLTTTKAEKTGTTQAMARIEKKVSDVETRNKRAMETLKKADAKAKADTRVISKSVAKAIETGNAAAKKTAQLEASIATLTAALKAEQRKIKTLTTRAAGDGETIAFLQKELSLVKKKADTLDHTFVERNFFDQELARIKSGYDKKIDRLIRLVEKGEKAEKADKAKIPASPGTPPAKQTPSGTISEKDLLQ
jgi:chromosome segregation ATPase